MNYKEKYEAALGWVRTVYPTLTGADKEDAEHYFPELSESEDDRIRREIREYLYNELHDIKQLTPRTNQYERWLAYLEKQKEQKPTAEEVLIKAGLKPFKDGNQWCILVGANIQEGICGFGDTIDDALYHFLRETMAYQKEQKPAEWSEEDEKKLNSIILKLRHDGGLLYEKEITFLKSLRMQSHWKPSEEQMQSLKHAYSMMNGQAGTDLADLYYDLKKL